MVLWWLIYGRSRWPFLVEISKYLSALIRLLLNSLLLNEKAMNNVCPH